MNQHLKHPTHSVILGPVSFYSCLMDTSYMEANISHEKKRINESKNFGPSQNYEILGHNYEEGEIFSYTLTWYW